MVEDEAAQVLARGLDAMGGKHLADARKDARPSRDQAIEEPLLLLLERSDGTRTGVRPLGLRHKPRAAVRSRKRLRPQLALREVGFHEEAILLALLAKQTHEGVPAARALELVGDGRVVKHERGEKVSRSHATEIGVDAIAHAGFEPDDAPEARVYLPHGGTHRASGEVGLVRDLHDGDAGFAKDAEQDALLVGHVLGKDGVQRLLRGHDQMVVGIARDGARARGLEPGAHGGDLADDGAARNTQGAGKLRTRAGTLAQGAQKPSLSLAEHRRYERMPLSIRSIPLSTLERGQARHMRR